jgi:hypothetical protein
MPYTRKQWQNDVTKLNAENMNNIEEGIEEAIASSSEALQEATNAVLKANKASQDIEKLRQDINYVNVSKESIEEALGYTPSDGDYTNLTNKPTIPSKITDLENDSTFVSEEHLNQKVTELTESKAEKSELTAQDNRIKLIENAYIKSVEYEPGTGIFRFTMQDGTVKTMDLAIEKVVTNFEYDPGIEITNLTGVTVTVPANWTSPQNYGRYLLLGSCTVSNTVYPFWTNGTNPTFSIGWRVSSSSDGSTENNIGFASRTENATSTTYRNITPSSSFSIKVDGGIDATNQSLIQWFKNNNATFEGVKPNPFLKLTLADGTVQSIPLSDFITDYTGVENDQIQVSVQSGNKIEAILKDNSVTLAKLNDDVKEHFATKEEVASQLGDINSILDSLVDITFTINIYDYSKTTVLVTTQAKQGMTWREWAESEYNTYGAYITNNTVMFPVGSTSYEYPAGICVGGGGVNIDDPIDPNTTYVLD